MDVEQRALWNGTAGRGWVAAQQVTDVMFKPFEHMLVEAVCAGRGRRVLEVGCGTGGVTVAVARVLGADSRCTGIDISEPMITAAQARADRENVQATFIRADAQTHTFQPASFDMIISRFGVMFFDDPVRAFENLRHAGTDSAELQFMAWRSAEENPFMTTAEHAAAPLLPSLPARRPDEPGQFAFADPHRMESILESSGWTEIDISPIDVDCTLPESELTTYFTRLGPVGRVLQDAGEETGARVIEAVRNAFQPYVHGNEVRFTAACWTVTARAAVATHT